MNFKYFNNWLIIGAGILILARSEFFNNLFVFILFIAAGGIISLIGLVKFFKDRKKDNER
jgi:hypothetical protein